MSSARPPTRNSFAVGGFILVSVLLMLTLAATFHIAGVAATRAGRPPAQDPPIVIVQPERPDGGMLALRGANWPPDQVVFVYLREPTLGEQVAISVQADALGEFVVDVPAPDPRWSALPGVDVIVRNADQSIEWAQHVTFGADTVSIQSVESFTPIPPPTEIPPTPTYTAVPPPTNTPQPTRMPLPTPVPALISLSKAFPDWTGEYFDDPELHHAAPVLIRNDPVISFTWGTDAPVPGVPADNFSVRWTRRVDFEPGSYRFSIRVDDGVRVWIDDVNVIEQWDEGLHTLVKDISPGAGSHVVKVEMRELFGNALINFSFERLVPYNCWKAEYFDNRNLTGAPVWITDDRAIHFDWRDRSPNEDKKVPRDNFSVRWTRGIEFAEGVSTFHIRVDDGVRLKIDGQTVFDSEWREGAAREVVPVPVDLTAGSHQVVLEYFDAAGNATVAFYIEPPARADAWRGMYYQGNKLEGIGEYPILVRYDTALDFDWRGGSPERCGLLPDSFSARWTRDFPTPRDGRYRFSVTVDDGVRVYVGEGDKLQRVRDEWHAANSATYSFLVDLKQGKNPLRVEYYELGGLARIHVGEPEWVEDLPTPWQVPTSTPTPTLTPSPTGSCGCPVGCACVTPVP